MGAAMWSSLRFGNHCLRRRSIENEITEVDMRVDLTGGKPIRCSKCGSTRAVRPVNDRDVEIRCEDCGHFWMVATLRWDDGKEVIEGWYYDSAITTTMPPEDK